MKRIFTLILVIATWLSFSGLALAAEKVSTESERNWTAHFAFGGYKLRYLDDDVKGSPVKTIFGDSYSLMFQMGIERLVWKGVGTVGVEGQFGYWQNSGKALFLSGEKSPDTTVFNMIPLKASVVYRFDYLWQEFHVPFVPFAKLGLDYTIWWILDYKGETASYDGKEALGGTFGFHVSYGLQLCLDFLDPKLATEFDQDAGVNNTYLYIEGTYARVDDFFSSSSFDLSDHHFMVGLLFEF